ncbi:MAG: hypothetical protein FWG83_02405 [Oscillospiraceae bacterium]|nr:hypothetical protein [Oscillospiraceae bacterium]
MKKDKNKDSVIESLEKALEGDVEKLEEFEETEEDSSTVAEPLAPLSDKPIVKRFFVGIAAFMIVFSVIGVINTFGFVSGKVEDIRERKALKDEFALFVAPVVINDPPDYASVNDLQASTIIASAIWKIILTEDVSKYSSDIGVVYIPEVDVESAARSIFGIGNVEHKSVFNAGVEFRYNIDNKNYAIPEKPALHSYSPVITSVTNVGELYTVTVDYMEPSPLAIAGIEHRNEPIKTKIFMISRSEGKKTINSIQTKTAPMF